MAAPRVVVTGIGALTPIGLGADAYWNGLLAGTSGAAPITYFDTERFKTRFACELKGFVAEDFLDKKIARRMDLFQQYAVAAANEAIQDAAWNLEKLDPTRIGVVVGSGIGGLNTIETEIQAFFSGDGTPRYNPFFVPKMIIDLAPGHISMQHGLRGPNYACVSACATASNCIVDGWLLIRSGMVDAMVVGGAEAAVTPTGIGGFNAMKALSERNDDPATASRPFDLNRDGFVLGEGSGALILESLEHALKRGAKIYAELAGCALTSDAYHMTAPDPEAKGVTALMHNVVQNAGVSLSDVDHINTHGTSTPLGDIAETKAIKGVFGDHAAKIKVNSTKSMTGHLLGAAGAVEAVATLLAVHHDTVPPTINHFTDDPECDLDYTFHKPAHLPVNVAICNTFGFGGHNASLLFKKYIA